MKRITEFALLGSVMLSVTGFAVGQATEIAGADKDASPTSASRSLLRMPALPSGTSTILGGSIRDVDPVLDRFTLGIVGEKPMKILFDERTQIFLDGKRIPLNQLRPSEHASVQTTLDGTSVFAISVHILSQLQQGEYQGEVVSYDPNTGDLELVSGRGGQPIRIRVTSDTKFDRTGQGSFASAQSGPADLQRGSLVSMQFNPDGKGRGSATRITLIAMPGAKFVFSGNLVALDLHAGSMMLLDPRDNHNYQIDFNPGSISSIRNIQPGQRVRISAEYDGTRYLAQDVTAY